MQATWHLCPGRVHSSVIFGIPGDEATGCILKTLLKQCVAQIQAGRPIIVILSPA